MVWGLFPVDPLPGEHEYYIFRKGTYRVGRKGCDIIIDKDKGVSRLHAEIIVDEMICMDHLQKRQPNNSSMVRIRDCSKYGTFINKNLGSKENVHEFPNKETILKEGDLVSFGTGNAIYRFSFVPLLFFVPSSGMNQLLDEMSLIGASVTQTWTSRCTHMVIDDSTLINDEIIDAIVARKPIVRFSWMELIAGKTICTEMPSLLLHAPVLIVEGISLKVADPQSREQCLKGYTFLRLSIHKYKFKEKLQLFLEVGGAKVVENQDLCRRASHNYGDNLVYVMPAGPSSCTEGSNNVNSLPRVKEMGLISAVISGHLDPSIVEYTPVLVTSSCSTDETVIADSDVDMETATSIPAPTAVNLIESAENDHQRKIEIHKIQSSENDSVAEKEFHIIESTERNSEENPGTFKSTTHRSPENEVHIVESAKCESGDNPGDFKSTADENPEFLPPNRVASNRGDPCQTSVMSDNLNNTWLRDGNEDIMLRKDKGHSSERENLDIIYSQDLIVRRPSLPQSGPLSSSEASINFKCFRKKNTQSGNSFNNLIPFSKYPYEESDYGNEDVAESIKEEMKRKQMEAIADDLFNNEKGRKRGTSGSLLGLFARG